MRTLGQGEQKVPPLAAIIRARYAHLVTVVKVVERNEMRVTFLHVTSQGEGRINVESTGITTVQRDWAA